jgi:sugar phosphate isomerase/epimerase
MKPCISEATTLRASFADDVTAYAAAGWPGMEVWLTKLETHLKSHSVAQTRQLLQDRQLVLAAASYQGGLLLAHGEQRRAHLDHFRRRLELCERFAIPTLVLAADFDQPVEPGTVDRAIASLREAAAWAESFGVRLAVEFRGRAAFCSNLATAAALVIACGQPNVGVALDVFHYYSGPSKFEDLTAIDPQRLALVQVSDVAGVPRELMTDVDRILPGDGDFGLDAVIRHLRSSGYDGWVSLELFNPTLWQVPTTQVAELGHAAMRRLLATG